MSTIYAALASGTDVNRLGCAAHEVGHGVAFQAAGARVRWMKVWPDSARGGWSGRTQADDDLMRDSHGWQIVLLAGEAAAYRFCHIYAGCSRERARMFAQAGSDHDIAEFSKLRGTRLLSLAEARTRATALITRHSTRIDQLPLRLAAAKRLPGSVL